MILAAIAAVMIGGCLLSLLVGRAFGRAEMSDALDAETWRANLWQKRTEELEQLLHVRPVTLGSDRHA